MQEYITSLLKKLRSWVCSSNGRAAVSKIAGWGFEALRTRLSLRQWKHYLRLNFCVIVDKRKLLQDNNTLWMTTQRSICTFSAVSSADKLQTLLKANSHNRRSRDTSAKPWRYSAGPCGRYPE